ncbi:MAG: LamB/YcsF family protein [Kofleriaceae bacterium]|nr:LamB/YcsF family protein [Kofleriaceae bacterium]MBP9206922.1 LamB/YcsF family protein [Kofleriaceae bacterium]
MTTRVLLDAGEADDEPAALWACAHVLAVACGGHAGDEVSMRRVVAWAAGHGVAVAAHPSYPDAAGFGRRVLALSPAALADTIAAQCRALRSVATPLGVAVDVVKPHGALYHQAAADPTVAAAVLAGVAASLGRVALVGPGTGALAEAAGAAGWRYLREGLADRGVDATGALIARGRPGALLGPAAAAARARVLSPEVDLVGVHADGADALAVARAVRAAVEPGWSAGAG